MSTKIYCGIGIVPKGSKMGNAKECAKKKQIRYYGAQKVDGKILDLALGNVGKDIRQDHTKQMTKYVKMLALIKNEKRRLAAEKKPENKKKIEQNIKDIEKKAKAQYEIYNELNEKVKKLDKMISRPSGSKNSKRSKRSKNSKNSKRS